MSQPTVSHRLKNLEDELQFKLFTRKKGCKHRCWFCLPQPEI
ncbi:MAG: LysR family transcriptional regulator [Clostridiales bacterium]|nr:LysR family transcriptional regulator [Clostridiales bacterium]